MGGANNELDVTDYVRVENSNTDNIASVEGSKVNYCRRTLTKSNNKKQNKKGS